MLAFTLARRRAAQLPRNALNIANRRNYVTQPPVLDEGEQNIFKKLTDKFSPKDLAVQDVSGEQEPMYRIYMIMEYAAGGCGTFYAISLSSEAFKGLSTVKQHRLVNETLKKEIEGIHGLQVSCERLLCIQ